MSNTSDIDRKMADDFKSFISKGETGARTDLKELIEKWGSNACSKICKVGSTWEYASSKITPLWFVSLFRSKLLASDLIESGADLSSQDPSQPLMQAWRYAAFNGWAKEAAMLFEAQAMAKGYIEGGWSEVWSAIEEGCKAQEEGWGGKTANWIENLAGSKLSVKEKEMMGVFGKVFDKSIQLPLNGVTQKKAEGWEHLCRAAKWLWGPCKTDECEEAMRGHSEVKKLALEMCEKDPLWAQSMLEKMVNEKSELTNEDMLSLDSFLGAVSALNANVPYNTKDWEQVDWEEVKEASNQWATRAARLVAMGAVWPKDLVSLACMKEEWSKVYRLVLAGAPIDDMAEPPLWMLAKSRASNQMRSVLAPLTPNYIDTQALDISKALGVRGAKATDKGSDGLNAIEKLESKDDLSALFSLGKEFVNVISSQKSATSKSEPTAEERLVKKGLIPLRDYLNSLKEREEIEKETGEGQRASSGSFRL